MIAANVKRIFVVRWQPERDLVAVMVSWILVVGTLYTASVIVGPQAWNGIAYFLLYALLAAGLFGVGIPLYWTVVVRKRSLRTWGSQGIGYGLAWGFRLFLYSCN